MIARALLAAALAACAMGGCGGDCDAPPTPVAPSVTAAPASPTSTPSVTPTGTAGEFDVIVSEPRFVIPSGAVPPELPPDNSNNNVDILIHDGLPVPGLAHGAAPLRRPGHPPVRHVVGRRRRDLGIRARRLPRHRHARAAPARLRRVSAAHVLRGRQRRRPVRADAALADAPPRPRRVVRARDSHRRAARCRGI